MDESFEKQLGQFLKSHRGARSMVVFGHRLGVPKSTVCRLERAEQSITFRSLRQILRALRCDLREAVPSVCRGCPHLPLENRRQ